MYFYISLFLYITFVINSKYDIVKSISNEINVVSLRKDNILTLVPNAHSTKINLTFLKANYRY